MAIRGRPRRRKITTEPPHTVTVAQARQMGYRQTEVQFQQAILDLAQRYDWRVFHLYDSRLATGLGAGFPDLVLIHEGSASGRPRLLVRELKIEGGVLSDEQVIWLATLSACLVDAKVWTPDDWAEIEDTLQHP